MWKGVIIKGFSSFVPLYLFHLPKIPIKLHTGPNICCLKPCMGPALVPKHVTDCLAWAQHCPQNVVLMVLYGPSIGFKICCRSSCMGPALAPNSATDGLIWAHYWSHMCCRWSCMGLARAQKYSTDGIVCVQHLSQNILPITLYGPRAGLNRLSCMGPALVPTFAA